MKKSIYFILLLVPMLLRGMEHPHDDVEVSNQREALLKSLLDFKILPESLDIQDDLSQLTLVWQDTHQQISVKIKAAMSPKLTIELSKEGVGEILDGRPEFNIHTFKEQSYKPYLNSINKKIDLFMTEQNNIKSKLEWKLIVDESKLKTNSTVKELELLFDLYKYNSRMPREIYFHTLREIILRKTNNQLGLTLGGYTH